MSREAARAVLVLGAVAVLTRAAVFGDVTYFNDEYFYWDAGLRMHDGLLPYVGVWDRKGPGLFLLYGAITGVSRSVLGFQIAACLSAWATACVLRATARTMMGPIGALMTGVLYLAALPMFGGQGGQSPVFYNLFVALAVWLLVRGSTAPPPRDNAAQPAPGMIPPRGAGVAPAVPAAMALAGTALTFKFSAAPEAAFLGLSALARMWRQVPPGRLVLRAGAMVAAGLAPLALFALAYAALGHLGAFWQALFASNLRRGYETVDAGARILALTRSASPALVLAAIGLALPGPGVRARLFAAGWLAAAAIGVTMPPSFYHHYMLPLMLPVALAAGFAMDRRPWGPFAGAIAALILTVAGGAFDTTRPAQSRATLTALIAQIRARDPAPRVLVYEGPMALYGLMDTWPPSPLLDNFHLYFPLENDSSPFDTAAETTRDLAWRPSVVITYHAWLAAEENPRSAALVHAYLRQCRFWGTRSYGEAVGAHTIDVWGDCGKGVG